MSPPLKVVLVEVSLLRRNLEADGRTELLARKVWDTEKAECAEHVRAQKSGRRRDDRAPIVPDQESSIFAKRLHQPDKVGHEIDDVVRLDFVRRVGVAVPALVWRHDAEAGSREDWDLVAPAIPGFRPSMAEEHERTIALLHIVHADPVGMGVTVAQFGCHVSATSKALQLFWESTRGRSGTPREAPRLRRAELAPRTRRTGHGRRRR